MAQLTWPRTLPTFPVPTFLNEFTFLDGFIGWVVPNYLDNLEVISANPTNGTVYVKPGAAIFANQVWIGNIFYTNDSNVSVAITSAANNRIDRIVLRSNRITKIIGVEGAVPAKPALTAGDLPLAWIYVYSGFNAATTTVNSEFIHDERLFADIGSEPVNYDNDLNFMHNFEYMAFARGGATNTPPEKWKLVNAPTTIAPYASLFTTRNFSNRSTALSLTCDGGAGITTIIPLPKTGVDTYTIRFNHQDTNGSYYMTIQNYILGSGVFSTTTKWLSRINTDPIQDEIIRFTTTATADAIAITFISQAAASVLRLSPILVTQGLCTTYNYPRKHEIIMVDRVLQDASWTATAKSTSTTNINLNTSFGTNVRRGTLAVIARLEGNDSGSAATAVNRLILGASFGGTYAITCAGAVRVGLLPNDFKRSEVAYIPVNYNDANVPIRAVVTASGAGTFDATIEIIGVIT